MRMSKLFGRTSKTEGADYVVPSHKLLTQAGYIRESTAGRYYLLPLGAIVNDKIIQVVKRHMNQAGAEEILMPILHPIELWRETNRTTTTGFELMKITDRRDGDFVLGGTGEEMAVDLVRKFNLSYRDLPFNIYQVSMKFRDELRARAGLLRVREFIMKDAYSFSAEEQFSDIYEQMRKTYVAIFNELGLDVDVIQADNGYIGGEYCHEIVLRSEVGESRYFLEEGSDYAAHEDVARFKVNDMNLDIEMAEMKEVEAARNGSMDDGSKFHKLPLWQQIKDVLYVDEATNRYILALVRGDLDVNEIKLTHIADAWSMRMATNEEIREDLNSEPGFISPINMPKKSKKGRQVIIVGDPSLHTVKNAYGGANKMHRDNININIDRDFKPDIEGDIALARTGFTGPNGGKLIESKGIEVGNIFQLGYHYSRLMTDAEYTDQNGKRQKYYMGCYGIGIGRTLASIVEAHHDNSGIVWPENLAPYKVHIVQLGNSEASSKEAEKLYSKLQELNVSVIYDDRNLSAGEKLADADLLGMPHRIVVSDKTAESQTYEYKKRDSNLKEYFQFDNLLVKIS